MKINILARSILGFAMILGGCTAIFVGVAGGYRSPLAPSTDALATTAGTPGVNPAPLTAAVFIGGRERTPTRE